MNTVKKISLSLIRLFLVVLAPELAYSQSVRQKLPGVTTAHTGPEDLQTQQVRKDRYTSKEIPMSNFIITYRGTVYPWQCDHMGHMNVMWYTGKFDEASWQLLSRLGINRSRFSREGVGAVALKQRTEYLNELHAGELITIRSKVLEVGEKTIRVCHEMTNDETGELAAITFILGLCIDARVRKARALPADVHERLKLMVAGADDPNTAISIDAPVEDGHHMAHVT